MERRLLQRDKLTVWLESHGDGWAFIGVDRGGWAGTSEYEYTVAFDPAALSAALGVPVSGLADVLAERAEEIVNAGETKWLTRLGVEFRLSNWYSFDD